MDPFRADPFANLFTARHHHDPFSSSAFFGGSLFDDIPFENGGNRTHTTTYTTKGGTVQITRYEILREIKSLGSTNLESILYNKFGLNYIKIDVAKHNCIIMHINFDVI